MNSNCGKIVVGVRDLALSQIMDEAVEVLRKLCGLSAQPALNKERKKVPEI